jgi:glycogen synthase
MDDGGFDIIHANDWTTVPGGVTLSRHAEKPLVLTIHSTENERGFEGDHAEMISELEWQGSFEADRVLATNSGTADSLRFDLDGPDTKLEVINPYDSEWLSKLLKIYEKTAKNKAEAIN